MRGGAASWLLRLYTGDPTAHHNAAAPPAHSPLLHLLATLAPPAVAAAGIAWGLLQLADENRRPTRPGNDDDLWSWP